MNKRIAPYYWMTVPAVVLFFVFMTLPALGHLLFIYEL